MAKQKHSHGFRVVCDGPNVPIIMLTACADEDDSLFSYELGADDYLIKPYNSRILAAKVCRFFQQLPQPEAEVLEAGGSR